jgi:hypothetical protein
MKILPILACLSVLTLLGACTTPPAAPQAQLLIASELRAQSEAWVVAQRSASEASQPVQFGPYSTTKFEPRWTRERDFMVVSPIQLAQAKQKFSFTQQGADDQRAEVVAMTTFRNAGFRWVNGTLTGDITQTTTFAGSITPIQSKPTPIKFKSLSGILNNGEFAWEFIVYNPEGSQDAPIDSGMIQDILGNQILIRALRTPVENPSNGPRNLGFEYVQHGQSIGAVSTLSAPTIWLRHDLSSELKLTLSSLSSALLIRQGMQAQTTPH